MISSIRSQSCRAFTLIELLVVIAIIALLAGIGFGGIQFAMKAAHNAEASSMLNNIKIAMSAYQSDYSRLPIPEDAGGQDYTVSEEEDWKEMVIMLQGGKDPFTLEKVESLRFPNPRETSYMEFKKKDLTSEGALKDPSFGKTKAFFVMILDGDYDGIVRVPEDPATRNIKEETPVNSSVAIYSRGGGTEEKPDAALISW
jgi:prepilin-type N-terminal cleavage/methylation domain-containing protein